MKTRWGTYAPTAMWRISAVAAFVASALVLLLIPLIPSARPPYLPFFIAAAAMAFLGVIGLLLARRTPTAQQKVDGVNEAPRDQIG